MSESRGTATGGDGVGKRTGATPAIWEGRRLRLIEVSYGSSHGKRSGDLLFTGRVRIGLGQQGFARAATVRTADGAVTALAAAIRTVLTADPFHFGELPDVKLLDYTISLSAPEDGIHSSAIARAKVLLNGTVVEREAVHPDGVIAACLVLCQAYDAYLADRWSALLGIGGMTIDDALRSGDDFDIESP